MTPERAELVQAVLEQSALYAVSPVMLLCLAAGYLVVRR
jgi:hypothetical protein